MQYKLEIYTWPACPGVTYEKRESFHDTPFSALAALEMETGPYHGAQLFDVAGGDEIPCDWDGSHGGLYDRKGYVKGTNGKHPIHIALQADWKTMVEMVREERKRTGEPMMDIAHNLLAERHPYAIILSGHLAWDAASK
jgi:hypothetical protein